MNIYKQPGDVLELTAPVGGVTKDTPVLIGSLFVIPAVTAAATVKFSGLVTGVVTLAKTSAQAWTEGQKIYWDDGNSRCDSTPTVGQLIGVAAAAAANPSATGTVRLNGAVPETLEGPQAAISDFTDSTGGTPSTTAIADLADGTTYANDHAALENNLASISAKINTILAALRTAGIIST